MQLVSREVIDMGSMCVWCREDTRVGSGKFVNRIPVGCTVADLPYDMPWIEDKSAFVEGYGCEECYEDED